MHRDLILAIDQGTTGSTCLLVDEALRPVAWATQEFPQHYPQPGWVEHDPREVWGSVLAALAQALAKGRVDPSRIAGIGITNQRETALVWDRDTGEPIHRAVVWQCRRTAEACQRLHEAGLLARVRGVTGLVLDPYFSGTKLAWILDHVQGARAAAAAGELAAGTIDTFLLHRLTGGQVHATEPSNACRTMLWPLAGDGWSEELARALDVPLGVLPEVRPSNARFGETRGVPGLPDGIPIHGVLGDQQAALFGQACFARGQAKCTYGTGAFVVLNTEDRVVRSERGLLTSVAWQLDDVVHYCLEGAAFMAGAVVQWLRDGLGIIAHAAEIEALAASVPDSGGVVLVPGHSGLGAPHWRPHARGLIKGLTRGTTRAHLARAALEGIALQITDLVEAMRADTGTAVEVLRVDGGAAANDLLMQIQSDQLGIPLQRPPLLESTALGAARLAGLGSGFYDGLDQLDRSWSPERTFTPHAAPEAIAELRRRWTEAVTQA